MGRGKVKRIRGEGSRLWRNEEMGEMRGKEEAVPVAP